MNFLGKNKHNILENVEIPAVDEHISEMLVKRDSFFHSCWMILKTRRPDIWDDMSKIELYVSGYDDPTAKKVDEKTRNDESSSNPVVL